MFDLLLPVGVAIHDRQQPNGRLLRLWLEMQLRRPQQDFCRFRLWLLLLQQLRRRQVLKNKLKIFILSGLTVNDVIVLKNWSTQCFNIYALK